MRNLDWTAIVVAIIALVGSVVTTLKVRQQARKPNIVDQAGQVSTLAIEQMHRMANEVEVLEGEVDRLRHRIYLLEQEVIRLGGDPRLVLHAER
jgi:hypothetical protein